MNLLSKTISANNKYLFLYYSLMISAANFYLTSCNSNPQLTDKPVMNQKKLEKHLANANHIYAETEDDQINEYIARHGYKMDTASTGLRYLIYKKGKGKKAQNKKQAEINYKVWTLDGTLCYDSDSLGSFNLKIGESDLPEGLQQGLLLMREGDKAIMIMTSHLAYGLTGDGNKISSNAALVMDVELVKTE